MTKRILILACNPREDIQTTIEIRDIKQAIKRSINPEKFTVVFEIGVQPKNLLNIFEKNKPYIVHFCGHGAGEEGLIFHGNESREQLVRNKALSELFKLYGDNTKCVLLNACNTFFQADAILPYVPYVIVTSGEIPDKAAYCFGCGFYTALGSGESIEFCFKAGQLSIATNLSHLNIKADIEDNYRKGTVVLEVESSKTIEPLKIILKKNSRLNNADLSANIPIEFVEKIQEEGNRKKYYDKLRDVLERFGQTIIEREESISQFEKRQRKTFLKKVHDFWIEGFLKPSLYFNTAVDKTRDDPSGQILRPLTNLEVIPIDIDESYDELRRTDIMAEIGDGKTLLLLILGNPGSGKTIALLQLAERLIKLTQQDMRKPIPVVFNLSSWGQKQQPLDQWLIEELKDTYQVPKTWSKHWIKNQQLTLLLDGLDEVGAGLDDKLKAIELRNACVKAINKFIATHLETEIVVCSRVKDYEALTEKFLPNSAICIQALSRKQLKEFLENADDSLVGLKTVIEKDQEIAEFAQTPLILNMMTWAYHDWSAEECYLQFRIAKDRLHNLFESYIEKNLDQENKVNKYTKNNVLLWLGWLAKWMVKESQTVFLIEKIQPHWLPSRTEQNIYHILVRLIVVLIMGIDEGIYLIYFSFDHNSWNSELIPRILTAGMLSGLISGVIVGIVYFFKINRLIKVLTSGVIFALTIAIILKLFNFELSPYIARFILVSILMSVGYNFIREEIKPVDTIEFKTTRIKNFSILGFIVGVLYVLIKLCIGLGNYNEVGYVYIVFEILICIIVFGILGGFKIQEEKIPQKKARPNEGIKRAKKYALISFLIVGPFAALTGWLVDKPSYPVYLIYLGLAFGLLGWLCLGEGSGIVLIQHLTLRLILYCKKYIPWNYADFLNYVSYPSPSKCRLMKKVGGGYVFYHRMLMEHFARKKLD